MTPIRTAVALAMIAALVAAFGHPVLALAPALAAVLLTVFVLRVVIRLRRQRRARMASDVIGKAVATTKAMREGLMTSESVMRTVQLARAEIAHAGASEARTVLDELEREAREHPDGVPGHVVAEARLRFDAIMRANLQ